MAEPRDEISEWLGQEVQPLAPPPGTFARIQRRARRRKMNQALMTAASAGIVIARAALTSTVGAGWYGVSAPVTGAPDGSAGVSQVRFLDLNNGWAYGPELWSTSDGGRRWHQEQTFGLRVTALETAGTRAFAVLASCQGSGAAYAANCSTFSLYTSLRGSTSLQQIPLKIPASLRATAMSGQGQAASASLVLTGGPSGGTGY